MNQDVRKLMAVENVNRERAQRLLDRFGSYDAVMGASYQQLIDTYYIGEVTARSVFNEGKSEPSSLL